MEMMVFTVTIKNGMLSRTEKFHDIFIPDSQYSVCQFIKGFFINLLGIKLLPAASQHNFGTFFQLQTDPPFIHHLQDKISIGRKAHKS